MLLHLGAHCIPYSFQSVVVGFQVYTIMPIPFTNSQPAFVPALNHICSLLKLDFVFYPCNLRCPAFSLHYTDWGLCVQIISDLFIDLHTSWSSCTQVLFLIIQIFHFLWLTFLLSFSPYMAQFYFSIHII